LVLRSDFLALAAGPLDPALAFAAGLAAALETFFVSFTGLVAFFAAGLAADLGFASFAEALVEVEDFLVFGSAFEAALEEAFFGATVAFANLTSRYCRDFGNY
jgi:hypothetical protein